MDGVFFDLDGTLLENRLHFPSVLVRVLAQHGLDCTSEQVKVALKRCWVWYEKNVGVYQDQEFLFWRAFNSCVCNALGAGDRAEALGEEVTEMFHDIDRPALYPDALPCLNSLADASVTLGIITARPDATRIIEPLGIADRFSWVVDAFTARSAKLNDRAFRFALKLSGLVAERTVHVGDQYELDVVPARSAGMMAVLLDRKNRHEEANCPRIASLYDLPQWLEQQE